MAKERGFMNFLYIHLSVLTTEPFLHASREQLGTWLLLYAYCASHENGGRIKNCRNWSPATWSRVIGSDTPSDCPLWFWHNEDLVIVAYDKENQDLVQRKRKGGKKGAQRRWNVSPEAMTGDAQK